MNIRASSARPLFTACLLGLATLISLRAAAAGELSPDDQQFLKAYTQTHDALVADNLAAASKAAAAMPAQAGAPVASAKSLDDARKAFGALAPRAEKLASGQPGYHVFFCPMVSKDWVQTGADAMNPYLGKDMLTCGVEKK
jgi:hypothetical protein